MAKPASKMGLGPLNSAPVPHKVGKGTKGSQTKMKPGKVGGYC